MKKSAGEAQSVRKTADPAKAPRLTSGPLLDWFYVHAGYVSEETGTVSICVDGKLIRDLTRDDLGRKLTELCLESVEGGE